MRDLTGDDVPLKNIGKAPSPKRKICFPGFRPHIAWDLETGAPIAIEFRNGRARATTTIKKFVRELLSQSFGTSQVERVYLDSEYTAEHVWKFIVDNQEGLGADLTMCVKQNKRVKKFINDFLETNPTWIYFDEDHTFTADKSFLNCSKKSISMRSSDPRINSPRSPYLKCFHMPAHTPRWIFPRSQVEPSYKPDW